MARKENEKDSERPHYYSQFWLDVAAGRRIIGAPKSNEEEDLDLELEPAALHKDGRNNNAAMSDGYTETIAHPEVEPELDAEKFAEVEPELDELEMENEDEDREMPEILEVLEVPEILEVPEVPEAVPQIPLVVVDEAEIPDVDFAPADEAAEDAEAEEEIFEDEDEDEDSVGWSGGRGRKKPKPSRQVKPPVKKPTKREPRRGY